MNSDGDTHCYECAHVKKLCERVTELERNDKELRKQMYGKNVKVGIAGCRKFTDYDTFLEYMRKWESDVLKDDRISEFVSGGAKGVDALAERYAKEKNIPIKVFRPDWNKYGNRAGPLRNIDIVNASDYIVAFPSKCSRGTRDTIRKAKRARKNVTVYEI